MKIQRKVGIIYEAKYQRRPKSIWLKTQMKNLFEQTYGIFPPPLSIIIRKSDNVYFLEGVGLRLVMTDGFIFPYEVGRMPSAHMEAFF